MFTRFETMFEDTIQNSANTKRWFNYVGSIFLLHHGLGLFAKTYVIFIQNELFALNSDRNLFINSELFGQYFLVLRAKFFNMSSDNRLVFFEFFATDLFV